MFCLHDSVCWQQGTESRTTILVAHLESPGVLGLVDLCDGWEDSGRAVCVLSPIDGFTRASKHKHLVLWQEGDWGGDLNTGRAIRVNQREDVESIVGSCESDVITLLADEVPVLGGINTRTGVGEPIANTGERVNFLLCNGAILTGSDVDEEVSVLADNIDE